MTSRINCKCSLQASDLSKSPITNKWPRLEFIRIFFFFFFSKFFAVKTVGEIKPSERWSHKNTFDTPCWRESMGRLGRLYRFFAKQKQLELSSTHFVVSTLKSAFVPNFSQIGEVKWPPIFEKVRMLQTNALNELEMETGSSLFDNTHFM